MIWIKLIYIGFNKKNNYLSQKLIRFSPTVYFFVPNYFRTQILLGYKIFWLTILQIQKCWKRKVVKLITEQLSTCTLSPVGGKMITLTWNSSVALLTLTWNNESFSRIGINPKLQYMINIIPKI